MSFSLYIWALFCLELDLGRNGLQWLYNCEKPLWELSLIIREDFNIIWPSEVVQLGSQSVMYDNLSFVGHRRPVYRKWIQASSNCFKILGKYLPSLLLKFKMDFVLIEPLEVLSPPCPSNFDLGWLHLLCASIGHCLTWMFIFNLFWSDLTFGFWLKVEFQSMSESSGLESL